MLGGNKKVRLKKNENILRQSSTCSHQSYWHHYQKMEWKTTSMLHSVHAQIRHENTIHSMNLKMNNMISEICMLSTTHHTIPLKWDVRMVFQQIIRREKSLATVKNPDLHSDIPCFFFCRNIYAHWIVTFFWQVFVLNLVSNRCK